LKARVRASSLSIFFVDVDAGVAADADAQLAPVRAKRL